MSADVPLAERTTRAGEAPASAVSKALAASSGWRWWELALGIIAIASWWLLGDHALLLNEIAILALFALSLDLILGYAGIVSLGHAAFFGLGAYTAALFAKHVMPDPLLGLVVIGPLLGRFEFDLQGRTAYAYSLAVLIVVLLVARRLVHSPFGVSLQALRDNRLRASAIGLSVNARLAGVYTIAAAIAGAAGALLAQTAGFASLDVLDFHRSADVLLVLVIGGTGYLYGGIVGAIAFKLMHDLLSAWTPQYWTFWLGLFLVVLVMVGRERLFKPWRWFK